MGRWPFLGYKRILPQVIQESREKTELRGNKVGTSCQPKPLGRVELCLGPQA